MVPANNKERRKSVRRKVFLGGKISTGVENPVPCVNSPCIIKDMTKDGARILLRSDSILPERLTVEIPAKECTLKARLMWRSGDMAGICFDGFDSGSKQSIPFEPVATDTGWRN